MARLAKTALVLDGPKDYSLPVDEWPDQIALRRMLDTSNALADDEVVGGVLRFQRGDGFAWYVVTKDRPLTLQWVDVGDAWYVEPALIRGLRRVDVEAHLRSHRALVALFRGSDKS